jgi:hypothetical protein
MQKVRGSLDRVMLRVCSDMWRSWLGLHLNLQGVLLATRKALLLRFLLDAWILLGFHRDTWRILLGFYLD